MLALFRKKQKGLKWVLWIVILALAAGMVLLFVDTPGDVASGLSGQEVAQVNGKPISIQEYNKQYQRLYEMYRQIYKLDRQDPEIVKQLGLKQQALNQLISEYAVESQAAKMGIGVTPEEVRQQITTLPVFQQNGKFIGFERYQELLQANEMTVAEFEGGVRRDLLRQKVMQVLTDGVFASAEEVRQEYASRNQEAKVRYVAIDKSAAETVELPETELRAYYDKNKENFRAGEQRQVGYVFVQADPTQVKVSPEDVQARLNSIAPEEQVHARHMLFNATEGTDDTEARKKAEAALARVRAGEDFGKVAQEVSEDAGTKAQGGELGFFGRGRMMPEFEQVAFSLPPGQVSGLVKTPFGIHLINVLEKTSTNPDSQRPLIEFELRQKEAERQARDLAFKVTNAAKSKDLQQAAAEFKLQVRTSRPFAVGDSIPGMMVRNDFNRRIFAMKKGEVTQPSQGPGGFFVAQLTEITPPTIQPFEEVRERIVNEMKASRAEESARQKAFTVQAAVKTGDFEAAAKKAGLPVTTTAYFKKGTNVDDTLRFSPQLHDQAFTMTEGQVSAPIEIAGKYVIFQLVDRTDVDMAKFEAEKPQIEQELTQQKRGRFFNSYVQNLIKEMEKNNEIIINQSLLDQRFS